MRPLAIHGPLTPPSAKPLPAGRRHGEYVARLGITCHPRSRTAKGEDHAPACRWEKGSAARGGRLERARRGHTLGHTRPLDQEILLGNSLRKLVDRGRIELPTPGFSDLGLKSWKCVKLLDVKRRVARAFVRRSALE